MAAQARAAGAIVRVAPFVRDDAEIARAAVTDALRGADVVITVGGVSVGDHDVIRPALEAAGVTLDFWRVKIKPGKPLAVGRAGSTQSSASRATRPRRRSPSSSSVSRSCARSRGRGSPPARLRARVAGSVRREPGREEFRRARLEQSEGGLVARLFSNQDSGAVTSFAEAEALVVIPAERAGVEDGDTLEIIRLGDV